MKKLTPPLPPLLNIFMPSRSIMGRINVVSSVLVLCLQLFVLSIPRPVTLEVDTLIFTPYLLDQNNKRDSLVHDTNLSGFPCRLLEMPVGIP